VRESGGGDLGHAPAAAEADGGGGVGAHHGQDSARGIWRRAEGLCQR